MLPAVFTPEPARCTACAADPPTRERILWSCVPIASYGDLRCARVVTIGLNPSDNLFYRRGSRQARPMPTRPPMLADFHAEHRHALRDADVAVAVGRQRAYFADIAAHPWFARLQNVLDGAGKGWRYADGSAAHLDLACCATDQWGLLPVGVRSTLLRTCLPHALDSLAETDAGATLLLNGRTVSGMLAGRLRVGKQGSLPAGRGRLEWWRGELEIERAGWREFLGWNLSAQRLSFRLCHDLGTLSQSDGHA